MADADPGYITVNPAVAAGFYNVVAMRHDGHDEYSVFRISDRLRLAAANALAVSWSAALGWRIHESQNRGDDQAV